VCLPVLHLGWICDKTVLDRSYKEHKTPIVRKAVIELLPSLATYNPDGFVSARTYLSETIEVRRCSKCKGVCERSV
jgi:hypothetical protein